MAKAKPKPQTKKTMPGDVEALCAILARIVERIAQNPTMSSKAGA